MPSNDQPAAQDRATQVWRSSEAGSVPDSQEGTHEGRVGSEPDVFSGASGQREVGPAGNEGRPSGSEPTAAQRCEIKTPDGKLQCGRPADHAGPHVHVAANGTTAWGGVTRV